MIRNPGRADIPIALTADDEIVSHPKCPDCKGRGWFLINPFATGGGNGLGGVHNLTQCLTCRAAHDHWQTHGTLPPDFESRIDRDGTIALISREITERNP